jgi:acetyl-CoA carboxylase carboxyltransferase component
MIGRAELSRHVDELAEAHSGRVFADAVQAYADELDEESREQLKEVLLERAASLDQAIMDRVDSRGWLRRQWDKAAQPPPRR